MSDKTQQLRQPGAGSIAMCQAWIPRQAFNSLPSQASDIQRHRASNMGPTSQDKGPPSLLPACPLFPVLGDMHWMAGGYDGGSIQNNIWAREPGEGWGGAFQGSRLEVNSQI